MTNNSLSLPYLDHYRYVHTTPTHNTARHRYPSHQRSQHTTSHNSKYLQFEFTLKSSHHRHIHPTATHERHYESENMVFSHERQSEHTLVNDESPPPSIETNSLLQHIHGLEQFVAFRVQKLFQAIDMLSERHDLHVERDSFDTRIQGMEKRILSLTTFYHPRYHPPPPSTKRDDNHGSMPNKANFYLKTRP